MATWLVLHKRHTGYGDIIGETYEYPLGIPNSKQVNLGDFIVFCLTKKSSDDDRRILGYGKIIELEPKPPSMDDPLKRERVVAHLSDYHKLEPPLSFKDIGGDPRTNLTNSINRIDFDFQGYSSLAVKPPANDDFRNKQYYARTIRNGQPKLREALLMAYGNCCSISGHGPLNVLEACHILPHSTSGNNQIDNGLLLRSDLHCLFDDGLLKINPNTYRVEIDSSLLNGPYALFDGQIIRKRLDGKWPSKAYLKERYNT